MLIELEISFSEIEILKRNRYFQYSLDWKLKEKVAPFFGKEIVKIELFNLDSFGVEDPKAFIENIINIEKRLNFIDIDKGIVGFSNGEAIKIDSFIATFFDKSRPLIKRHRDYIFGGHNIINWDKKILENSSTYQEISKSYNFIDTLYLSIVLRTPSSHRLLKNYENSRKNSNPIEDAKESRELFDEILEVFRELSIEDKKFFASNLKDSIYFKSFVNR